MSFSLDEFKGSMASTNWGGFTRNNLFEIEMGFPAKLGAGETQKQNTVKYLARAAQIPSYTQGNVEVPFRGRTLKIAGDRTYEPWTVTFMNDQKQIARNIFEKWVSLIQGNEYNFSAKSDDKLFGNAVCSLLNRVVKDGEDYKVLRSYKLYDIWPSSVSAVDLDWGNNDAVQEFTVEFQVQFVTQGKDKSQAETNKGGSEDVESDQAPD